MFDNLRIVLNTVWDFLKAQTVPCLDISFATFLISIFVISTIILCINIYLGKDQDL